MQRASDKLDARMEHPKHSGFQYQHGDRPLDGYTVQRALGRGGFGEVYYALSDSGRQVALKAVQGYEQIELRGVRQCMNLKNPHLVTIFDIRHSDRGRPFVIMEYVTGPSLRELLDESPEGLGTQKATYFLQEIAKGLTYLHEAGIVHRDLKPGNIFFEDGYVKIGDYGLSKAMSPTHHSGQTVTVGTVHYMAPEIGEGRYDNTIDIYALGVVLYEMLKGHPPYSGASISEVLLKHVSGTPDLSGIPEPFASAIAKAMHRDPDKRFTTAEEMVQAVLGTDHVRQSVSVFSPTCLTVVAGKAARAIEDTPPVGPSVAGADAPPRPGSTPPPLPADKFRKKVRQAAEDIRDGAKELKQNIHAKVNAKAAGGQNAQATPTPAPVVQRAATPRRIDTMTGRQRAWLALMTTGLVAVGVGLLRPDGTASVVGFLSRAPLTFASIALATLAALLARRRLNIERESKNMWRVGVGGAAAICGALPGLAMMTRTGSNAAAGTTLAIAIGLFLMNWKKMISPERKERVSLGAAVGIAAIGLAIAAMADGDFAMVIGVLAGTALAAQVFAPMGIDPRSRREAALQLEQDRTQQITVSPCKRLWALALGAGWFMGFGGLHRFYAGKIVTGILWFFTGGLFGIGQLVDMILVLTGRFRDRQGRLLVVWADRSELQATATAPPPHQGGQPSPIEVQGQRGPSVGAMFVSSVGGLLMFAGILVMLAVGVNLPAILSAGLPHPAVAAEIENALQYEGWPGLLDRLGQFLAVGVLLLASLLLILGRRRSGFGPMLRVPLGALGLLPATLALREATGDVNWPVFAELIRLDKAGVAIDGMLQQIELAPAILAGVLVLASVVVLCWPVSEKRQLIADDRSSDPEPITEAEAAS